MFSPMLNSVLNFTIRIKELVTLKVFFTYYGINETQLRTWKKFNERPKDNQKIFVAKLDGSCFNVVRYHESKMVNNKFGNRYVLWHDVPTKKQLTEQKNFLELKDTPNEYQDD